jgi:hypothetical protein
MERWITKPNLEFYPLGYNAGESVDSQPTFWRNMSPPSSWSKNMPSTKPEDMLATCFHVGSLLGFFMDYPTLYPRRQNSS